MGLEQNEAQHYREVPDKFVDPVVSYQLKTYDQVVRPDCANGNLTITLPPVAEARGRFYSIVLRGVPGGNAVTVEDYKDDSECWPGDLTLDTACDRVLAYSDGLTWFMWLAALNSPS